jgi:hypothetical protein
MEKDISYLMKNNEWNIFSIMSCEGIRGRWDGQSLGEWLEKHKVDFLEWREVCGKVDVSKCEEQVQVPIEIEGAGLTSDERKCFSQLVVRLMRGLGLCESLAMAIATQNMLYGWGEVKGIRADEGRHSNFEYSPEGGFNGSWDNVVGWLEDM